MVVQGVEVHAVVELEAAQQQLAVLEEQEVEREVDPLEYQGEDLEEEEGQGEVEGGREVGGRGKGDSFLLPFLVFFSFFHLVFYMKLFISIFFIFFFFWLGSIHFSFGLVHSFIRYNSFILEAKNMN